MERKRRRFVTVSALYVDIERGPYRDLVGEENCYGVDRDARTFRGPGPVVAHPPCGPWGAMRMFCTKQDASLGPLAVAQVRKYGGVLEHPCGSLLWRHCEMPRPFRRLPTFVGREWALQVDQVRWGHPCRKRTWLFFVGVTPRDLPPLPPPRNETHLMTTTRNRADGAGGWRRTCPTCGKKKLDTKDAHLTPPPFAEWLLRSVGYVPTGKPTHSIGGTKEWRDATGLPIMSSINAHLTPTPFARWLLEAVDK